MKTLIIIPAYNEAAKIGEVIGGIKVCGDWDILVVDDGSLDETATLAKQAVAIVLRHKINRGQGAALKTGLEFASRSEYKTAVFFDADGQMSPLEIKLLNDKLAEGYDVVLGSRFLGRTIAMPMAKRLILKAGLIFTRLSTGLKLTDAHNGFQAWTVEALKRINLNQDRQAYASQLLSEIARNKLNFAEVPVTISYSDYSIKKGQSIFNAFNILWDLLVK